MRNRYSEPKSLRLLWAGIAFAVYFTLIGLLLFYFNHHNSQKSIHFVKKDEKRIQLATSSPTKAIKIKTIIKKSPQKPKKALKAKTKPKIITKPKVKPIEKKSLIKEKIVKKNRLKKRDENKTKPKPKKINRPKHKVEKEIKKIVKQKKASDLFSSVNTGTKNVEIKKVEKNKILVKEKPQSASKKISETIKNQKQSDSGIENAYFAKVQSLLETWPAQSDYAGEKAMVRIYVKPTGMFEFKVKSQSENVDFNLGLIDFLMQLQRIGLGRHNAGKTYEFEVEFIAKE
jgi:protein TonB